MKEQQQANAQTGKRKDRPTNNKKAAANASTGRKDTGNHESD